MVRQFSYKKLSKSPKYFNRLTGVSFKEFKKIIEKCRPYWQAFCDSKKKQGRPCGIGGGGLEDQVLCAIIYYRFYTTHMFIGFLFGVHETAVTRCLKRIEPILIDAVKIQKPKKLSEEKLEAMIFDCTEQAVERPSKKQRKYYSGKKKDTRSRPKSGLIAEQTAS